MNQIKVPLRLEFHNKEKFNDLSSYEKTWAPLLATILSQLIKDWTIISENFIFNHFG